MRGARTPSSLGGRLTGLLALLAAILALLAGCSDDDDPELPPPGQPGAPAAFVPAGSPLYLDVTTDEDSEQWMQAGALAARFPGFAGLLRDLEEELAAEGVTLDQLRDVAGDRAGFALLRIPSEEALDSEDVDFLVVVAELAEGREEAALELLTGGDSDLTSQGEREGVEYFTGDEIALAIVDETLVAAPGEETLFAALDAHEAGGDDTLAGEAAFMEALAELPDETAGTAFLDVAGIVRALTDEVPELRDLGFVAVPDEAAVGVAAVAEGDVVHITGVGVGLPQSEGGDFAPTLLERAPADAIAYLGFRDIAGTIGRSFREAEGEATEGLRDQIEFFSGQLQAALGVSTDDLAALFGGEQAIVVTPGVEYPGVALLLQVDDPARARSVLERLRTGVPPLLAGTGAGGRQFRQVPLDNGVEGWELPLFPGVSVVYGVEDDVVILGTTTEAVRQVQTPEGSLADAPAFEAGAAARPEAVSGLLLVDVQRALEALDAAGVLGRAPPELIQNLEPLRGLIAWATSGERSAFEAFLSVGE